MATPATRCILKCLENLHEPISLPHKVEIFVGRNPETKITDSACSKKQVKVMADLEKKTVAVTPLGLNYCGLNGYCLSKGRTYNLNDKDRLELLLNKFIHEIEFDPCHVTEETNRLKRRATDDVASKTDKKGKPDLKQINNTFEMGQWEEVDNRAMLIYTSENVRPSAKIASYDMDGTLIKTKSGAVFPKDVNDWQMIFSEVIPELRKLHEDGYKIVLFTNQAGIGRGKVRVADIKRKLENLVAKIQLPIQVFISTGKGMYRKPIPGMWNALCKEKNDGISVDLTKSFYCGDAAGREVNWAPKKKKDHSMVDRLFALNIGIKFYTPEEHFLKARSVPFKMPEFDPRNIATQQLCEPRDAKLIMETPEVIVMVGFPGSGKSHFSKTVLVEAGYKHVNRDTLGSWQKCVAATENALKNNERVVVDNTNPDKATRQKYVSAAKQFKVPCRCFLMNTSYQQSKHNNIFREITDKTHVPVTDMIINGYKTKYEEPTLSEGFEEIVKINVLPKFTNTEQEHLYHLFLLEK